MYLLTYHKERLHRLLKNYMAPVEVLRDSEFSNLRTPVLLL